MHAPSIRRVTALLPVDSVERSLAFWHKAGLSVTVEVPHGDALGFAIVAGEGVELMLQSHASIMDDVPAVAEAARQGPSFLFVEVEDLDTVEAAMAGEPVFLPRRTTFYGAIEIGYREPNGHYVTFAQFSAGEEAERT
jgi:hypothetical protein